jgi:putative ABC transport system permease protein
MIAASLKGLLGRKLRTCLTAIAIVLGVAMVCGTLVMTATVRVAMTSFFTDANRGTTAVVVGHQVIRSDQDTTAPPPISASLVDAIRRVPGVAFAQGRVEDTAQLLDHQGRTIGADGPPHLGYSVLSERLNALHVLPGGRWPVGPHEIAIDSYTAHANGYAVGDTIRVSTKLPTESFRITGLVRLGSLDTDGATFAVFSERTAQRLFRKQGEVDRIRVAAAPGVSTAELVRRLQAAHLRSDVPLDIRTAAQDSRDSARGALLFVDFLGYALLAFGGIALFVGAFIIFNTFSITIAQRTRELALLRMIGASRRQVLGATVVEALLVGVAASLLGTALGLAIGAGLMALFKAMGAGLPQAPLQLSPGTLAVPFVAGTLITLLASLAPAVRATRVPPAAAAREGVAFPRGRAGRAIPVIATVLLAGALATLAYGMLGSPGSTSARLLLVAAGSLALFLATAMLAGRLVPPLVAVLGVPLRRLGLPGRLACENAVRNPGRTAATSASLMVGLALVAFMSIFASAVNALENRGIDQHLSASYLISTKTYQGTFDGSLARRVAALPGVTYASPVREDLSLVNGHRHVAFGVQTARFAQGYRFQWEHGSDALIAGLRPHDVVMERTVASRANLHVGSSFVVTTPRGRHATFTVRGTFVDESLLDGYLMPLATYRQLFGEQDDSLLLVGRAPGADSAGVQAAIERAATPFPDARVDTPSDIKHRNDQDTQNVITLFDALLALSIVISLFGIVNTLVLSILERTREIGLLRAVGSSRRQVRRMVRYESVLTTLVGTVLGIGLGVVLAAMVIHAVGGGMAFALPLGQLAVLLVVAVVLGVGAAVFPARRASRLDVLEALAYE